MSDQQHDQVDPADVDPATVDPTTVDADGMGVSSERVGPTGPDQVDTDGVRDTSAVDSPEGADVPPEQRPGQVEQNPAGLEPKAAYPALDPRADDD